MRRDNPNPLRVVLIEDGLRLRIYLGDAVLPLIGLTSFRDDNPLLTLVQVSVDVCS